MKLSKRLQAIYNLVNSPCILADIGCDHALLPIALVQGKKCTQAYACDVNRGPLERGAKAIADAELENKIQTILTNGLQGVPEGVSCITIAGMGWETISSILEHDLDKAYACKQLILQSNNHVDDLRQWLMNHHFVIDQEDLVYEQHFYTILSVHPGDEILSAKQIQFGKFLDHHPLTNHYWNHVIEKKKVILAHLSNEHEMYKIVSDEICKIESYLQSCQL